ncbi:MAG: Ribosomal RNA large subunit methyltransferase A [Ktedonobacterales bacterium]|jgi:23S rRNA (guanine745-N1)-methyltransferase|nr:MAG: Ribosomal RNA large subunit methyltransferase A [Ktedonobacterales bacterium]
MLVCPLCELPLAQADHALRCERGHSFDLAREGYVNLLPPTRTGETGDTREMLRARRAFLARGCYAPLADALNALALAHLATYVAAAPISPHTILDAGCGEGYYIGRLYDALATGLPVAAQPHCYGLDVARDAARLAAKRYPGVRFVVANTHTRLPFATASLAVLLNIFAPRNPTEFARILAPGGLLLIAIPGPAHLAELRAALPLLGIENNKREHIAAQFTDAFTALAPHPLTYPMTLDAPAIHDLLAMTPSARHLPADAWASLAVLAHKEVTASFQILPFTRRD